MLHLISAIYLAILASHGCVAAQYGGEIRKRQTSCNTQYPPISGNTHTFCLPPSPLNLNAPGYQISAADKAIIVNAHNTYRRAADPPATDMQAVVWDDELAKLAQAWAEQCVLGHDSNRFSYVYNKEPGQNGFFGSASWQSCIDSWHNEKQYYTYGNSEGAGGEVIGHYTQVVQNHVAKVGCGYAKCNASYTHYLFCDYIGPNSDKARPYTNGTTCAACTSSCDNKLCNCSGKACFNGGTLDLNTCTCTCPATHSGEQCLTEVCTNLVCQNGGTQDVSNCKCQCRSPYTGTHCEIKSCPFKEGSVCGTQWPASYCTIYSNVKYDCPYMCGLCTESERPTCAQDPNCHQSAAGCIYMGTQASAADCATYGDNGADKSSCTWHWTCDSCTMYSNVKTDYCPIKCAYCPA